METNPVLVIGATGDVGRGVVAAAARRGWDVTGVARSADRLAGLVTEFKVHSRPADVGTAEGAQALASAVADVPWSAVVVSVNRHDGGGPLLGRPYREIADHLDANLGPHLHCLNAFVPILRPGAVLLGIGGGMADFVVPGTAPVAITQAGLRMAYRHAAREARATGVVVRELLIRAMVAVGDDPGGTNPHGITDEQVGERVCRILDDPEERSDTVLVLDPEPRENAR